MLHVITQIGAIVGALPPLMGWSAAGMSILTGEGLLLSTLLYTWLHTSPRHAHVYVSAHQTV